MVQPYEIANADYKRKNKELYSFLFEIVLKQDYEDIFFFRDFEVNGVTSNSPGSSPIRLVSTSLSPERRSTRNTNLGSHLQTEGGVASTATYEPARYSQGTQSRSPGKGSHSLYTNTLTPHSGKASTPGGTTIVHNQFEGANGQIHAAGGRMLVVSPSRQGVRAESPRSVAQSRSFHGHPHSHSMSVLKTD